MPGPLDGVRVLEMTNWMAAPSAGAILADMGAEVVKAEPLTGDPMRNMGRPTKIPADDPRSALDPGFLVDNRGKKSIAVAVDKQEGADLIRRLVADKHVFLTNLLPRRQEKYGLDSSSLLAINPALVHATLSGYGRSGPDSWRPGYDVTAFFGRGTITDASIEPGGLPPMPRPAQGDHTTGLALVASVLAALRLAETTGVGQVVDVSLFATAVWTQATELAPALVDKQPVTKRRRDQLVSILGNRFKCADGRWIILNMLENHWWPRFCEVVEQPTWLADERWKTVKGRFDTMPELLALVDALFASQPLQYWATRFDAGGLIWGPAQAVHEVINDPQARAEHFFVGVPGTPDNFETLAVPIRIAGAEIAPRGPAPALGEHTDTVLAAAGLTPGEIASLRVTGAIG